MTAQIIVQILLFGIALAMDAFAVSVTDDGPGFDPDRLPEDGQMHVGIANVRERLRQIVDGSLEYRSALGEGTTAIIRIPK